MKKFPLLKNVFFLFVLLWSLGIVLAICKYYLLVTPAGEGFVGGLNLWGGKFSFAVNSILFLLFSWKAFQSLFRKASIVWGIIWTYFIFAPYGVFGVIPAAAYWWLILQRKKKQED